MHVPQLYYQFCTIPTTREKAKVTLTNLMEHQALKNSAMMAVIIMILRSSGGENLGYDNGFRVYNEYNLDGGIYEFNVDN